VPEESVSARPPDRRVSTGAPGLDTMLEGGLVPRRPYLVVGPSGTGKTTLSLEFLIDGVRQGERCLFVTLEEPPNEIRVNHRGLGPELDEVEVFDAIPDIMRYERVPFKDIASVRAVTPFKHVPLAIRRSPELSAVEVTMTALEQMLRTEVVRRNYTRLVVDSLTALQYFCMKGFDPVAGAQAFVRFLSDLRITTILTVESPLEDVETPERMLARGEVRLFRWELDERTVRAVGVEKFRGSPHDVRLHPYRIGSRGIDVNLETTISRDTRQIIEPARATPVPTPAPTPIPVEEVISPVDPLAEQVRDLVLVGAELGPVRTELEAALGAAASGEVDRSHQHLSRASSLLIGVASSMIGGPAEPKSLPADVAEAYQRIVQRGEGARAGIPPTRLPPPKVLEVQLEWVLSLLPPVVEPPVVLGAPVPEEGAETSPPATPEPMPTEPATAPTEPPEVVLPPPVEVAVPTPQPPEPLVATTAPETRTERQEEPLTPLAPSKSLEPGPPAPSPLRAWSPPAPPPALPSHRAPGNIPSARAGATPPAALSRGAERTPAPPVRTEARPPLPSVPAGLRSNLTHASPGPIRPPAATPVNVRPPSGSAVAAPPPRAGPPAVGPPAPAATPGTKRRRKAPAPSRRRATLTAPPAASSPEPAAVGSPSAPSGAEVTSAAKPKRRPARKRKAPSVLTATPGLIPPGVYGTDAAASPPPPSKTDDERRTVSE
jgi:KaiC/GvpD/RAD55 family RecA-like ATPase